MPRSTQNRRARRWLFALLLAGVATGCHNRYTPEQERAALWLAEHQTAVKEDYLDTPARYIVEQLRPPRLDLQVLTHVSEGDYAEAVRSMSAVANEIRRGLEWKQPRRECTVPRLCAAPRIDGVLSADEWRGAERFHGEFEINDPVPFAPGKDSGWWIGWDETYLYFAAQFRDDEIVAWSEHAYGEAAKAFYNADCLEFFIRPSLRLLLYYEFLFNPNGEGWENLHCHREIGRWQRVCDDFSFGVRSAVGNRNGMTVYELAIPFRMLFGEWTLRGPREGDRFDFMPIRIDRGKHTFSRTTPAPFLYDGHNIFGYIQGTLGK